MIRTSVTEAVRILGTVDDWYPRRTLEPARRSSRGIRRACVTLTVIRIQLLARNMRSERDLRLRGPWREVNGLVAVRGSEAIQGQRSGECPAATAVRGCSLRIAPARNRVRRRRKVKSASVVVGAEQREEGRGRARRLPRPSLPPASCDLLRTFPPHSHLPLASPPSSAIQYSLVRTSLA